MSAATVKLRTDLLVSRHGDAERSFFVFKDPASERFFRFGETEHFITEQLDGETQVETVRQRVEERFGATLSVEALQQFIERLRKLGLVTDGTTEPSLQPARRPRIAGDLFYLRFKAFDPDRLFDRMEPAVRFLFTPTFLALSAALIVCAMGVTIVQWGNMTRELGELFRLESLALAWCITFVVIVAHEFAHGLTCKHFGGKVREIGFMLIYFQPAFYCNVSDAWLFPKKAQRLWVTFAGAYFEMFLWALATLFWRLTEPDTTLSYLALVVAATSAIRSFFNLNPLIKLDGYYLLSDWLVMPNLRRKAFTWFRERFKSLLTFSRPPADSVTSRERWIYFAYSVLAGAYTFWLLGVILSYMGSYLVGQYQAWGFALFSVLLFGIFRSPVRRAATELSAELSLARERRGRTLKRLAKIVLVLAGLAAALWYWHPELKVAGAFTLLPIRNAEVRAEVEGIIQTVYHEEGESIAQGEVIARLADRDFQAELHKIKAELEEKQARLKLLRAGARVEQIELARTTIAKAEERLKFSTQQLTRDEALLNQQLIARRDFETTAEQVSVRTKELQEARDQLKVLQAGSRPEEIEALEAEQRRLGAQQAHLEAQLQLLTLRSPVAGVITTRKLREKIGQLVEKGDLLAEVHQLTTVTAEIAVPEKDIADVHIGQRVVLKARAYPGASFEGKVIAIAPVASKPEDSRNQRTVIVTTEIDNESGMLKPQMSGMAKIYCGERRALELLGRRIVRYLRVEVWSWW